MMLSCTRGCRTYCVTKTLLTSALRTSTVPRELSNSLGNRRVSADVQLQKSDVLRQPGTASKLIGILGTLGNLGYPWRTPGLAWQVLRNPIWLPFHPPSGLSIQAHRNSTELNGSTILTYNCEKYLHTHMVLLTSIYVYIRYMHIYIYFLYRTFHVYIYIYLKWFYVCIMSIIPLIICILFIILYYTLYLIYYVVYSILYIYHI